MWDMVEHRCPSPPAPLVQTTGDRFTSYLYVYGKILP